ncbi:aspartyl-phosphate phosphatase Spo0E family protein [Paenibacillus nasutitermitis]|uniref:Aspartyl-phosphate phosphatase Spo0E family protein n=1 Tax=Paenibacillus nasutitermitis TaxID=1652958 RepID=A0A917E0G3_9BACL|nr:aspartyl-phosphate phosphatase Spo0E family protein [Paenibacillus nasutitermitis]GGD91084.1 hypothetical protein GCM10010911_57230 [Paenibacillus nasutitermitis]
MEKMQKLREELQVLVQRYGIQDSRVIRKSQQLDKLIVQYMKKAAIPSINWPSMNNLLDNHADRQSPPSLSIEDIQ